MGRCTGVAGSPPRTPAPARAEAERPDWGSTGRYCCRRPRGVSRHGGPRRSRNRLDMPAGPRRSLASVTITRIPRGRTTARVRLITARRCAGRSSAQGRAPCRAGAASRTALPVRVVTAGRQRRNGPAWRRAARRDDLVHRRRVAGHRHPDRVRQRLYRRPPSRSAPGHSAGVRHGRTAGAHHRQGEHVHRGNGQRASSRRSRTDRRCVSRRSALHPLPSRSWRPSRESSSRATSTTSRW